MEDKDGQIAGNQAINAMIYRCFEELDDSDQLKFVKKFRRQLSAPEQVMHTFRELILGAYLHTLGCCARYEQKLQGKTPDWVIEDDRADPQAIVELVNLHIDRKTESEIQKGLQDNSAVFTIWRDENADNLQRFYDRIEEKMTCYGELVKTLSLAYIVAVFVHFELDFDKDDVLDCLAWKPGALFEKYPYTSGVLLFAESSGGYNFQYFENPASLRKWDIVSAAYFGMVQKDD